jgi:ribosomal protein S18 acetylase RimI-like enzyme
VRAAYGKWVPLIGREPKPMTANYDEAVREHVVFVLEERGRLRGVLELIPGEDHLLIENVAVATDAQGRGIGQILMGHAEAVARERGLPQLRLYTNERFAANIQLYEKLGYEIYDRVAMGGGRAVWMRKDLA